MSDNFKNLPGGGPIDPRQLKNENFEHIQATVRSDNEETKSLFNEPILLNGIYLFELKIVAICETDFATFKRTFSVHRHDSLLRLLDINSDYTKRTQLEWRLEIVISENNVVVNVQSAQLRNVNWAGILTKTMFEET